VQRGTELQASISDFILCTEMPAWAPAVSECGCNTAQIETWTSLTSHPAVDREAQWLNETGRKVTCSSEGTEKEWFSK